MISSLWRILCTVFGFLVLFWIDPTISSPKHCLWTLFQPKRSLLQFSVSLLSLLTYCCPFASFGESCALFSDASCFSGLTLPVSSPHTACGRYVGPILAYINVLFRCIHCAPIVALLFWGVCFFDLFVCWFVC